MASGITISEFWRQLFRGVCVTVLIGWGVWATELRQGLERLSFDLPSLVAPGGPFPELVLVELDESSHDHLRQNTSKPWSRRLHAELVDFLIAEGARQIVFDVEFYETVDDPTETTALASSFTRHGAVVLGAYLEGHWKRGFAYTTSLRRPVAELLAPGVAWGVSWSLPGPRGEEDGIVRLHPVGRDPDPSLPWMAAVSREPALSQGEARHDTERWVRHYGPGGTLPKVSYWRATNEVSGFYKGRTVFIGGRPPTGSPAQGSDRFRTAWSRWNGSAVSGLELTATAWLNLVRRDWLTQLPSWVEFLALTVIGAAVGGAVATGSLRRACLVSLGALAALSLGALWLFHSQGLWFNWALIAFVQAPAALLFRVGVSHLELRREKRWLEAPLEDLFAGHSSSGAAVSYSAEVDASASVCLPAPTVSDYTLLRCVGRGGYGEVWLARDVFGGFRAVKIVRRVGFADDGPYEREFQGLQKFAPLSREHPGLVQILHIGVNRTAGFFHYVMEIGDDAEQGRSVDPDSYVPRSLASDLRLHRCLDAAGTVELGRALCASLGFLHERGLIHRDIKPANILFVKGCPKLADVGLVTEIVSRAGRVTQVGTLGYMAPEGSGTAAGDVFALGRLLLEALGPVPSSSSDGTLALRLILEKAQAARLEDRFPSVGTVNAALEGWQNEYLPCDKSLS